MPKNYAFIMDFGACYGLRENNGLRIFRVARAGSRVHTHTHQYEFELPTVTARFMVNITVRGENSDFHWGIFSIHLTIYIIGGKYYY